MIANPEIHVEVRALGSGESPSEPGGKGTAGKFSGTLHKTLGTRLTVATISDSCPLPVGTLVEVETPTRLYLGEIKHLSQGKAFIDFEHELEKSALESLRKVWC